MKKSDVRKLTQRIREFLKFAESVEKLFAFFARNLSLLWLIWKWFQEF